MALCQQASAGVDEQNHYRGATFPDSCHTKTTKLLWFVLWQTALQKTHRQRWKSWNSYIPTLRTRLQWPWRSKHNIPEKSNNIQKCFNVFFAKSCVFSNVVFYEMPLRFLSSRRDARGRRTQPSIFCLSVSFLATLQENSKKASRFRDWGWFIHTHISADCTGRFCWFHFLRKWNCDIGTVRTSSDSAALAFSLSISQSLTWGRFPSVFLSFSLPLRLSLYSITCMHDLHRYSPLLTIYTFLL